MKLDYLLALEKILNKASRDKAVVPVSCRLTIGGKTYNWDKDRQEFVEDTCRLTIGGKTYNWDKDRQELVVPDHQ